MACRKVGPHEVEARLALDDTTLVEYLAFIPEDGKVYPFEARMKAAAPEGIVPFVSIETGSPTLKRSR